MTRLNCLLPLLALVATLFPVTDSAQEGRPNGAGIVVRHGDGTLIYSYVEFSGDSISGEELLLRSGLDIIVTPYGGLGTAVCSIDGEGCPASDCFCQSYGSPALFWHYFGWNGGSWEPLLRGPTSRTLRDGDIDGWSWSDGEAGLPPVSIDEIAAITGFSRSPAATATATATLTSTPTEIIQTTPTAHPTETPLPTLASTSTETPSPAVPTQTATRETPSPQPTLTEPEPRPPASVPPATPTASEPAIPTRTPAPSAPTLTPSATSAPATGAVIVRPGATPEPLDLTASAADDERSDLLVFAGFALLIACAGGIALARRRQSGDTA